MDYMRFSDDVESIFTHKDLEKTPTAEVQQFVPPMEVGMDDLSPEEEQILQKTMHRLAERVCMCVCVFGGGGGGGGGTMHRLAARVCLVCVSVLFVYVYRIHYYHSI